MSEIVVTPSGALNVGDRVTFADVGAPPLWPWLVRLAARIAGVDLPARPPAEYRITSVVSSQ